MHSSYNNADVEQMLNKWHAIMGEWNDKKAKEITAAVFEPMKLCSSRLYETALNAQRVVNRISDENDTIF